MNFYKLYIGDYQRDTGHLSLAEHGAYVLMLNTFYATAKPLPQGDALYRLLRASTRQDKDAIDAVVKQFWKSTRAGLINERGQKELAKYDEISNTNKKIALAREAKKRAATVHEP